MIVESGRGAPGPTGATHTGDLRKGRSVDTMIGVVVVATTALAAGLAGGVLIRTVATRRRRRLPAHTIVLRAYWYTLRRPRLETGAGRIRLTAPIFFGRRTLAIPLDRVAAVAPGAIPALPRFDDGVFAEGLSIPYLYTAFSTLERPRGPLPAPNLMLVFACPVEVPPLRASAAESKFVRLPFGYFSSRSARGVTVDGVLLAARDPEDAARRIADAGIEVVDDWREWLGRHPRDGTAPGRRETPHDRMLRGTVNTTVGALAALAVLVAVAAVVARLSS
jgi:hypothetical protein